jgi:hypothetical protein
MTRRITADLHQDFLIKLKTHLLPRVLELHKVNTEVGSKNELYLNNDRIYQHQVMTIHYTTYDIRRRRDIIHPGPKHTAHRDIMGLLAPEDQTSESRFWFAHVLGIYHANVIYAGEGSADHIPRRLDFLWIRYYSRSGRRAPHSLDQLKFPPVSEAESFGFVNPASVLRCCHIIPAFHKGRRLAVPAGGLVSACARNDRDWNAYYMNR